MHRTSFYVIFHHMNFGCENYYVREFDKWNFTVLTTTSSLNSSLHRPTMQSLYKQVLNTVSSDFVTSFLERLQKRLFLASEWSMGKRPDP